MFGLKTGLYPGHCPGRLMSDSLLLAAILLASGLSVIAVNLTAACR